MWYTFNGQWSSAPQGSRSYCMIKYRVRRGVCEPNLRALLDHTRRTHLRFFFYPSLDQPSWSVLWRKTRPDMSKDDQMSTGQLNRKRGQFDQIHKNVNNKWNRTGPTRNQHLFWAWKVTTEVFVLSRVAWSTWRQPGRRRGFRGGRLWTISTLLLFFPFSVFFMHWCVYRQLCDSQKL